MNLNRAAVLVCSLASISPRSMAQFFPIADATWCAGAGSEAYRYLMSAQPDTVFNEHLYQRIDRYRCVTGCGLFSIDDFEFDRSFLARSNSEG